MPTEAEWAEAVTISRTLSEQSNQAFDRFLEVCVALTSLFKRGRLATALRGFDGGPEYPADQAFWYTENFWSRFHTCQVHPERPYGRDVMPSGGLLIYIDRQSLETLLKGDTAEQRSNEALAKAANHYVSPYVACMIEISEALGISPGHQPKKESLKGEILKYWRGAEQLSAKDIDSMATLLRDPASKAGRAKKPVTES